MDKFELRGKLSEDCTRIILGNPEFCKRALRPLLEKELEIVVKKHRRLRSNAQNRWLWGVAYVTIKQWYKETQGEDITSEEIHAHNLSSIQGYRYDVKEILGEEVLIMEGKRTSKMSVEEFQQMMEKLQQYYAERGLVIPDPEGDSFLNDYQ